jgi:nucleotide-binding universal stress UspA family protein
MNESDMRYGYYRKILFCTDFSENANFAFDFAIDAALRNKGSTLYLFHVIPEPDAQFWKGYIYEVGDMDAKARDDIDRAIEADYRPRVPNGVDFQVEMRIGDAARAILEFAQQQDVDLIILGRQGRGAIAQWLLGNVAGKVARRALCPVLVVRWRSRLGCRRLNLLRDRGKVRRADEIVGRCVAVDDFDVVVHFGEIGRFVGRRIVAQAARQIADHVGARGAAERVGRHDAVPVGRERFLGQAAAADPADETGPGVVAIDVFPVARVAQQRIGIAGGDRV